MHAGFGWVGYAAALAAAASFATAGVLQQRAAARTSDKSALSVGLLGSLLRQRSWLVGVGLAAASYGLQAVALSAKPLTVVQPLLVTELLIGIPLSARLAGHVLGVRKWAGVLIIAAGLAATVWGAAPHHGGGAAGTAGRWIFAGGGLVAVTVALALGARGRSSMVRARLYATAAALLFALSAALLATTVEGLATHGLGVFARPAPYGVAATEVAAMLFIQSAFQAGPLSVAMPLVNWVQPLVAVLLGIGVLGESVATDPLHLVAVGVGALAALGGIVLLDVPAPAQPVRAPAQPVSCRSDCALAG